MCSRSLCPLYEDAAQISGLGPTSRCDRAGRNSPAAEPFFCCVCHGGIHVDTAPARHPSGQPPTAPPDASPSPTRMSPDPYTRGGSNLNRQWWVNLQSAVTPCAKYAASRAAPLRPSPAPMANSHRQRARTPAWCSGRCRSQPPSAWWPAWTGIRTLSPRRRDLRQD